MAEVLVEFDTFIRGMDGERWVPRACGGVGDDGMWEGWIEFTPVSESHEPVRTSRETQQANRNALMYWAQGLSQVYLEDALVRATDRPAARAVRSVTAEPHFDGPAPRRASGPAPQMPRAVLNPFEVYRQGEDILQRELSALDVTLVRDIAVAYALLGSSNAQALSRGELIAHIISNVRNMAAATGRPMEDRR